MKSLIVFICFSIFAVPTLNASSDGDSKFKCITGVGYIENECNNCFCGGAELACTEMACTSPINEQLKNCEKGQVWESGCERCWCIDIGTVCTTNCGKVQ